MDHIIFPLIIFDTQHLYHTNISMSIPSPTNVQNNTPTSSSPISNVHGNAPNAQNLETNENLPKSISSQPRPTAYSPDGSRPPVTSLEAKSRILQELHKPLTTMQRMALFMTGRVNRSAIPKQSMTHTRNGLGILIMGNICLAWYCLHAWGLNKEVMSY